jgi:hypothetical protein
MEPEEVIGAVKPSKEKMGIFMMLAVVFALAPLNQNIEYESIPMKSEAITEISIDDSPNTTGEPIRETSLSPLAISVNLLFWYLVASNGLTGYKRWRN